MAAVRLGRMSASTSAFFLCDMQDKFRQSIRYFPEIITVAQRMVAAANILEIPVIVTEQYPKGECQRYVLKFAALAHQKCMVTQTTRHGARKLCRQRTGGRKQKTVR
jgi:nicotinamidase-related amidase